MILPLDFEGPTQVAFTAMPETVLADGVMPRFLAMAKQYGERAAIADLDEVLTYGSLQQRVLSLAGYLSNLKQMHAVDTPVAFLLPHSVNAPIAMLACLAVGLPYVPLDPTFPLSRNRDIIRHSLAGLVLTDSNHLTLCQDIVPDGCHLIAVDTLKLSTASNELECAGNALAIAYIMYTSGSTGQPKGVYQNQRGLLHDVMQYVNSVHLNPQDCLSMLYSSSVLGAVRDIFGALLTGASVHMLSVKKLGISALLAQIKQRQLTILHAVPVLYRQLTQDSAAKQCFTSIRLVYLAGDRLDKTDAKFFQTLFSHNCFLYTGIGSTENTTIYRQWFISTTTALDHYTALPVGRAIPDRAVRIIDEVGRSLPSGEVGEIEVTSRYMALGYWQNEVLSQQCFVQSKTDRQARVFRTGDLGCEREDGLLAFYGRKDARIKLRGYLIMPADIEVTAKSCAGVHEAAVHIRRTSEGEACSLILYWHGIAELTEHALRHFLSTQLSLPQMPACCFKLTALPMLANFKIDRQKLALLDNIRVADNQQGAVFADDIAGRTLRVLAEVMSKPRVSLDDNLESLYADSLDVLRIILALEHEFKLKIATEQFYSHFTAAQVLVRFIEAQKNAE